MSSAIVPIQDHPQFEQSDSEKLGDEITELCGYIYAATQSGHWAGVASFCRSAFCQAARLYFFKASKTFALGQNELSPSSLLCNHRSQTASVAQLRQRCRTSFIMAGISPLVAISGSSPTDWIIDSIRRSELAIKYRLNPKTMAAAAPIIAIAAMT